MIYLKPRNFRVKNSCVLVKANMNNAKLNVYKKVLQEVSEKFDGAKKFVRDKIEEICSDEKLSVEEVT